jgi:hypothetical protein
VQEVDNNQTQSFEKNEKDILLLFKHAPNQVFSHRLEVLLNVYHITNSQACGLCENVKKSEKFRLDMCSSCTQKYFQRPQNKKIVPLASCNFNNRNEFTEFEK